ncbi:MAG: hypothetical protein JSS49_17980 [Planctomycetes bacterium]|nr:hypothetical protein [Planctomycetota bacterium]
MSIRLEVDGKVVEINEDTVVLGSDPGCSISLPQVGEMTPRHAVIRKIAGRWIVEVREAAFIRVGDQPSARMHWLNPGDVIYLTDTAPEIVFEPDAASRRTVSVRATLDADPPTSESRPRSQPKSMVVPSLKNVVELDDVASAGKSEDGSVGVRPLPRLGTSSYGGDLPRPRRSGLPRGLVLKIVLGVVLLIVAVGGWQLGRPRRVPLLPSNPDPVPATTLVQPPATVAGGVGDPNPTSKPDPVPESIGPPRTKPAPKPTETKVASKPPETTSPAIPPVSPATPNDATETPQAVRDAVYAVFAKHPEADHYFRLGTAWAASRRSLVTSGAVALAVEELQGKGLTVVVSNPSLKQPVSIKGARVHAAYRQAKEREMLAHEQLDAAAAGKPLKTNEEDVVPPEEKLVRSNSAQSRFDVGVLDVASGERLPSTLDMDSGDLPDVSRIEYVMVGFPFPESDYQASSTTLAGPPGERRCPQGGAVKSDSTLMLTMTFPDGLAAENWSGSPVCDGSHRVIGVYSRVSKAGKPPEKHAVIWLGRLREFAPDLE